MQAIASGLDCFDYHATAKSLCPLLVSLVVGSFDPAKTLDDLALKLSRAAGRKTRAWMFPARIVNASMCAFS
jgi:hypothetical protein